MTVARLGALLSLLAVIPAVAVEDGPALLLPTAAPSARIATPSCKPGAPLLVTLTTTPISAATVELAYELTPMLDAVWVDVDLVLDPGGRVLSHQTPASNALVSGASRSGRALVELPEGVRAGRHAGELRVVASMGFVTDDGSVERVATEARAMLGEGDLPMDARPVRSGDLVTRDLAARHQGAAR